jgi:hypothetical protein
VRAVERDGEGQLAGLAGGEMDRDDVVGITGENFAHERHAGHVVARGGERGVEIELATVVGGGVVARKREAHIAEGLIGQLAHGIAEHLCAREVLCFLDFAVPEELADLRDDRAGAGAHVVVRLAAPERVFVELDAFARGATEDHRAEAAAAERESFVPFCGGPGEPEDGGPRTEDGVGGGQRSGGSEEERGEGGEAHGGRRG